MTEESEMVEKHVFGPFKHGVGAPDFQRADLEFYSIDHYKPSYVALIFFNDPDLKPENADRNRKTYAGSFSIFGHDTCTGDVGHCEIEKQQRRFDNRPSHPLTPAFKRVVVTDALKKAIKDKDELTVTVVAACPDDSHVHGPKLLEFKGLQLVAFD